MTISKFKKTAVAIAVAGTFAAGAIPVTEANVIDLTWRGAFTMLQPTGSGLESISSDYQSGYYGNGDQYSANSFGAPYYPINIGPGATPSGVYPGAYQTAHGWNGYRTPISGTLSFDTSTGAGVGTLNPFFFFGDNPGNGPGTYVARFPEFTFQTVDTVGTMVGSIQMSWNGSSHSISIVLDGSGLLSNLDTLISGGPTTSLSGVGVLPATEDIDLDRFKPVIILPLGPSPIATKTLNALGCEGQLLATQVAAQSIIPTGNIANCDLTQDDGIGGSPMVGPAFQDHNLNFDITSVHVSCLSLGGCPAPVPVPPAVWLFGSGLLGLMGLARRKRAYNELRYYDYKIQTGDNELTVTN